MFDALRKGLMEAYKHKPIEDSHCIVCSSKRPLALHILEYSHDETIPSPTPLVPMAQSRGRIKGAVPICDVCCPPCSKCGLPMVSTWIKKVRSELQSQLPQLNVSIGNGICQHIHPLHDLLGLLKKADLKGL